MNIRETLQNIYLQYVNDFLTVGAFADYYGVDDETADWLIDRGRQIHIEETER